MYAPSVSCESPTSELPGEAAAGEEFAQGGDHPSPPSLTPHFPRSSIQRRQDASPAPAVVSGDKPSETTASATWPISEDSRYAWAGSAAPNTVSGLRLSSLAFSVSGTRVSCRLTQHPLLGRSRP